LGQTHGDSRAEFQIIALVAEEDAPLMGYEAKKTSTPALGVVTAHTGATGGKPRRKANRIRRENWKREIRDRRANAGGPPPASGG
jgi:hypothetical protein